LRGLEQIISQLLPIGYSKDYRFIRINTSLTKPFLLVLACRTSSKGIRIAPRNRCLSYLYRFDSLCRQTACFPIFFMVSRHPQIQVHQYLLDGLFVFYKGYDTHGAITLGAQQRVGMVNLLNQTGPVRRGMPFLKYRNQPVKAPGCQFLFFCAYPVTCLNSTRNTGQVVLPCLRIWVTRANQSSAAKVSRTSPSMLINYNI